MARMITMGRKLRDGIQWIQGCVPRSGLTDEYTADPPDWYEPNRTVHTCQNAYLITGEETLLFDTLSPANRDQVLAEVADALDGRELDYLLPSHPEAPHAGNALAILDEHPETQLLAPGHGDEHELYHLGDARTVSSGDRIDLGGKTVEFLQPLFLDHAVHIWMRETTTETFFPVDWLGFPHMAGECLTCVEELDHEVTLDQLLAFHGRVFFWYQYVDVEKTNGVVGVITERYGDDLIAPAHGLPVSERAVPLLNRMQRVVEHVNQQGRLEVFG
jgi:flavorubredoxin